MKPQNFLKQHLRLNVMKAVRALMDEFLLPCLYVHVFILLLLFIYISYCTLGNCLQYTSCHSFPKAHEILNYIFNVYNFRANNRRETLSLLREWFYKKWNKIFFFLTSQRKGSHKMLLRKENCFYISRRISLV